MTGTWPRPFARPADPFRVMGRVHGIVETGHASGGDLRQGDRDLAVMDRGRGQDGAHRHAAIGRVKVKPASSPTDREALGVPPCAVAAGFRQVVGHPVKAHAIRLTFETPGPLLRLLALAGTAAPALRPLPGRRLRRRRLPALDHRRVPRDMADQLPSQDVLRESLVHALRKAGLGEPGGGAAPGPGQSFRQTPVSRKTLHERRVLQEPPVLEFFLTRCQNSPNQVPVLHREGFELRKQD